jgi:hypothetical protein
VPVGVGPRKDSARRRRGPVAREESAGKTADATNRKLWDEEHGTYLDYDLVSDRPIHVYFASTFSLLFAGVPDEGRTGRMVDSLENAGFELSNDAVVSVPSYDVGGFGFSPVQY